MNPPEEFLRKAHLVKDTFKTELNHKSLKFQYHEHDLSELEGVLARGDRRISKVIMKAYENGAVFDSWQEIFDRDKWDRAFTECDIDRKFYTEREREITEIFPWDFIDTGVSKEFLKAEWEKAKKETVTPNCRASCSGCGAASFGTGVCFERR